MLSAHILAPVVLNPNFLTIFIYLWSHADLKQFLAVQVVISDKGIKFISGDRLAICNWYLLSDWSTLPKYFSLAKKDVKIE